MPKVSIILPVYNAGKYLNKCIESLINQTLQDIEIVIVLDCPTDGSDEVAKSYAKQDSRIKIIENEENLRVGLSRNKGIEAATGEYIGFCDHDDYADASMFELAYSFAKKSESDIVVCDVDFISPNGTASRAIKYPNSLSGAELRELMLPALLKLYSKQDYSYGKTVWNLLLKRKFLSNNNLHFSDNKLITAEDALFLSKAYFLTDKIIHCDSKSSLYYHVGYPGSTQNTYSWLNIELVINYYVDLHSFLSKQKEMIKYQYYLGEGTIRHLYTAFQREMKIKGVKYAMQQMTIAKKNNAIQNCLKPLFSLKGMKYIVRNLPPTKILLLFFLK